MFDAPTNTLSLLVVTPLSTGHSTTGGMLHAPLSVVPRAGGTRGVYDAWNKASGAVVSRGTGRAADGRSGLKGSWWANADSHCASPLPTAAGRSPPASPDPFLCMTLPLSAPPREELNLAVLHAFVDLHEFTDLNLVQALR